MTKAELEKLIDDSIHKHFAEAARADSTPPAAAKLPENWQKLTDVQKIELGLRQKAEGLPANWEKMTAVKNPAWLEPARHAQISPAAFDRHRRQPISRMNGMQYEIDELITEHFPWDFSIKVRGVSYPTRPLTLGDLLKIETIQAPAMEMIEDGKRAAAKGSNIDGQQQTDTALKMLREMRDCLKSFFPGQCPDIDAWQPATMTAVIGKITAYWSSEQKKNAEARMAAQAAAPPAVETIQP